MLSYPGPLQRLIDELERLPGVGPKSAQRLALHLLSRPAQQAQQLAAALEALHAGLRECAECGNWAEAELCPICVQAGRDPTALCVVESPADLLALERAGEFRGRYHVLGGALSPMAGIGPQELRIEPLLARVARGEVQEVILATSPTVEGDATAEYLRERLCRAHPGLRLTRIALGLPVGADLDYADQVTLARALRGRTVME